MGKIAECNEFWNIWTIDANSDNINTTEFIDNANKTGNGHYEKFWPREKFLMVMDMTGKDNQNLLTCEI